MRRRIAISGSFGIDGAAEGGRTCRRAAVGSNGLALAGPYGSAKQRRGHEEEPQTARVTVVKPLPVLILQKRVWTNIDWLF
jgi:hypothetical protein